MDISRLRAMQDRFLKLPELGVTCSLLDIIPATEVSVDCQEFIVENQLLSLPHSSCIYKSIITEKKNALPFLVN